MWLSLRSHTGQRTQVHDVRLRGNSASSSKQRKSSGLDCPPLLTLPPSLSLLPETSQAEVASRWCCAVLSFFLGLAVCFRLKQAFANKIGGKIKISVVRRQLFPGRFKRCCCCCCELDRAEIERMRDRW
ncbi:hypothetical protein Mapa_010054 [Marchantia paleacea]|nr:hypothetical protein Mapa_010054 [Marchantia paleacea]